jgi:hypothetical protein
MIEEKVRILKKRPFDEDSLKQIKRHINHFLEFYLKKFGEETLKEFKIEIKELNFEGRQETFEINGLLITDFGRYHAKKVDLMI